MCVKRFVDFRMVPKKSSKGKGATAEPTREEGWMASKCSESDLGSLVYASLLSEKSVIQWRPALGEDHLHANTSEIVTFAPVSYTHLTLPTIA